MDIDVQEEKAEGERGRERGILKREKETEGVGC